VNVKQHRCKSLRSRSYECYNNLCVK